LSRVSRQIPLAPSPGCLKRPRTEGNEHLGSDARPEPRGCL
jgi:hypothetical protein